MNFYDQQFYDSSETTICQPDDEEHLKDPEYFDQELPFSVFLYSEFFFAFKGAALHRVSNSGNPFEFITGLGWRDFFGFGIDITLKLKFEALDIFITECCENSILLPKFKQIYNVVYHQDTKQRLKTARVIYNIIPSSNEVFIFDMYYHLIRQIAYQKRAHKFKFKKSTMTIDFFVFNCFGYQHFPERQRNCIKQEERLFRCKVCQIRKTKYFCGACYKITGKKWCFCLENCFRQFHSDPYPYVTQKITN